MTSLVPGAGTLGAVLGFVQGDVTWKLRVIDADWPDDEREVVGQTRPEGWTVRRKVDLARVDAVNDYDPLRAPTGGEVEAVTFQARFVSGNDYITGGAWTDLTPIQKRLEGWLKRADSLGRVPLLRHTYGANEFDVWLTGLSTSYPSGHWPATDNPVEIAFSIELTPAGSHDLDIIDPTEPERETVYHTLSQGETPELLGLLLHGDPLAGVLVRQTNREVVWFEPGDVVKVLDPNHSEMRRAIRPAGVPFATLDGLERLEALAQLRLGDSGIPWESQPDELRAL